MTPSDPSWSPPPCWYIPKFTSTQYEKYVNHHWVGTSDAYADIAEQMNKVHYYRNKKGKFWQLEYAKNTPNATLDCPYHNDFIWVKQADPHPPAGVPDAAMLARMAYAQTKLPAPNVKLSPDADHQKVNFATWASFSAPLGRVWVTAQLDGDGIHVAATTVATPTALKITAGTTYADPQSCTYRLAKAGSGYKVNTKHADCNITYRKSSGDGSYPLHADVTWKVHWTASANPDGPAHKPDLPDGLSTSHQAVRVQEIQSVTR